MVQVKSKTKKKLTLKITPKTNLAETLRTYPKAGEILFKEGLHCIGCEAAAFDTLEEAMKIHGFSQKKMSEIIKKINKTI